jgi:methylglyoxal synthase
MTTMATGTLALIAHDARMDELVAFAERRRHELARFALIATGTTGGRIIEATDLDLETMLSGPYGGDVQIGARLIDGQVAGMVFLRDPMTAHPHEPDIQALLKATRAQRATRSPLVGRGPPRQAEERAAPTRGAGPGASTSLQELGAG